MMVLVGWCWLQAEVQAGMEMEAAAETEAKAAAKATAKADMPARHPKRALPQEVVRPEGLAAQAVPTWAIPAPHLPAWVTALAARSLVVAARSLELIVLSVQANLQQGSSVFFDNLFTSFPLLNKLSEMRIAGTGTVRQNRLHRIPVVSKKDLEKKAVPRGHSDVLYKHDQVLVAWKDNKVSPV